MAAGRSRHARRARSGPASKLSCRRRRPPAECLRGGPELSPRARARGQARCRSRAAAAASRPGSGTRRARPGSPRTRLAPRPRALDRVRRVGVGRLGEHGLAGFAARRRCGPGRAGREPASRQPARPAPDAATQKRLERLVEGAVPHRSASASSSTQRGSSPGRWVGREEPSAEAVDREIVARCRGRAPRACGHVRRHRRSRLSPGGEFPERCRAPPHAGERTRIASTPCSSCSAAAQ
jgi:hypothetical protein